MRIAEVIGSVTLSDWHPSLNAARWRIVVPLTAAGLTNPALGRGEPLVTWDELSAGDGDLIGLSESAEAAAPFHPDQKPIDAYCAAIIDHLDVDSL